MPVMSVAQLGQEIMRIRNPVMGRGAALPARLLTGSSRRPAGLGAQALRLSRNDQVAAVLPKRPRGPRASLQEADRFRDAAAPLSGTIVPREL